VSHTLRHALLVLVAAVPALTGCGGGGGGGGTEVPSLTVIAAPEYDGVTSSGGFIAFRPEISSGLTGDLEDSFSPGFEMRQFFAFHLGALPAGARVVRAVLRLSQERVEGAPYDKNGNVVVDHVDYIPDPGPDTYDGQNLTRDIGTLSTSASLGRRSLVVTEAVRADLTAGRPWSQFHVRFYTPVILPYIDHVNDFVEFTDAEAYGGGEQPTLQIFYEP
jgi:hypothetical protein